MQRFLLRQIRAAYGGFVKWIGILVGAVAVGNWIVGHLSQSIAAWLDLIFSLYRGTFHPIADFLLGWTGVTLTDPMRDALLIYCALGGTMARTAYSYFSEVRALSDYHLGTWFEPIEHALDNRVLFFLIVAATFFLWPIAILALSIQPVLAINEAGELVLWTDWKGIREVRDDINEKDKPDVFTGWGLIDVRIVFLLQLLALLAATIGLLVANALAAEHLF